MKQKFILIWCILLCVLSANAQSNTNLQVFIRAAQNDSLNNLSLQLYLLPDTLLVNTQVARNEGNSFAVKRFAKYMIRISGIGYEHTEKLLGITDKPLSISLQVKRNTKAMENVVVVARKPLLKQEDDKTIVDAEVLANSSSNAYEVLEKTPGAIVDQDGNVYLSSMSPATIFINGREMKLSSEDLASLLKSLPASSVSKIEILRNPSAKYDAASSGGIVNIVLKKGVKLGSSGSVNAAYFQGVYSTKTCGININRSTGKVNTYFSYQYTNRNNYEDLGSSRLVKTDSTLLTQSSYTTYPSTNHYIGAGIDWAFTKKFNLAYDLRLSDNSGKSNADNTTNISRFPSPSILGKNSSAIQNQNNSLFLNNNISSKYKIDSSGSEWTAEMGYNYYRNKNNQQYINYFISPSGHTVQGDGENRNDKKIFTVQSDLILKLPYTYTVEAGFKVTISNSNTSAAYFYDTGNNVRQPDRYQTNTFTYRETIGAAYVQVAKTIAGFTFKPGLRLETTDINGRQLVPKDTTLSIKRTDLFPYLYLKHKLFKLFGFDLIGNAIYRRSIKRPYYEILNPYPKYVDQYLFDVGNPKLQPQFTTNYEANVTFDNFPVFALGINQTKNIFSNVTYQDDVTKIAYRTYDNLGMNREFYFRVVGGIPPGKRYFFYVGAQYNMNKYDGTYQNLPLHYQHGSWLFFIYQELKASKTLVLDMQGFIRTKGIQNFYELDNFGGMFLSANKSILNKKANIIFSINDVLQTNHVSFKLNQGNIYAEGKRVNDTRRLGITLRYNFGLSKPKENKEFGAPVEGKDN